MRPSNRTPSRVSLLILCAAALTASGIILGILASSGAASPLRWPLLALLVPVLAALALSALPSLFGLFAPRREAAPPRPSGASRTALLMPIHNEDPDAVFANIRVMREAIRAHGLGGIDMFVLSDTRDPAIAAAEERAWADLRAEFGPPVRYRRRAGNAGRKAGNIAEFCDRWGARYDFMIVLDADSLMTADAIAALIGAMEANPRAGIIQTVPYPVNRETLFARMVQFGARLHTPLWAEGAALWSGAAGNYWGHNAILRVAPFMRHCRLPVLPGHGPFSGEILCHDVVEAALMVRAGWQVLAMPRLDGSFEELPANLADYLGRERRWCQGNLQHLGFLRTAGLAAASRLHLLYGILYYLSGAATVALLALATIEPALFGGSSLLAGLHRAPGLALLGLVLVLSYGPKLLSLGAALCDAREARRFGGRAALLAGGIAELGFTVLTGPVMLWTTTRFVALTLAGRGIGWAAQPRDDRGLGWREARVHFGGPALLGLGWAALLAGTAPGLLAWAAPLIAGLLAGVPLSVWTSRRDLGLRARRLGLFLTRDEIAPAPELRARRAAAWTAPALVPSGPSMAELALSPAEAAE